MPPRTLYMTCSPRPSCIHASVPLCTWLRTPVPRPGEKFNTCLNTLPFQLVLQIPAPKMTALAYTHEAFARFNKGCPQPSCRQNHLPWGLTPTGFAAEETAYPMPLCHQLAAAAFTAGLDYHQLRASIGRQPKASNSLLSARARQWGDHARPAHLMQIPCHRTERLSHAFTLPSGCDCRMSIIPKHSQLLQLTQTVKEGQGQANITTAVWGVPFSRRLHEAGDTSRSSPVYTPRNFRLN